MKKIVAINASPRTNWNTAQIVKEAVKGGKEAEKALKENIFENKIG